MSGEAAAIMVMDIGIGPGTLQTQAPGPMPMFFCVDINPNRCWNANHTHNAACWLSARIPHSGRAG